MARLACKFAIVQYMPDDVKQELINIGIILHCPDQGIIYTRFLSQLNKVSKILTINQINEFRHFRNKMNKHVKSLKNKMIDPHLELSITFDYLDSLVNLNFNKFYVKRPTPLLTANPSEKLDELFNLYVYEEDYLEKREQPLVNVVWKKFKQAGIDNYIRKDVEIPNFPFPIDYGFQNGAPNLIQTIKFTDSSKDNFKEGLLWRDALILKEQEAAYKDSPFYAVVKPPADPQKHGYSLAVEQFINYNNVELVEFGSRQFDGLLHHIKEHGHALH